VENELPLVSIAIITYNQKSFLRDCIESCLKQDYPNYEIVVADDCSTDGTRDMLQEYQIEYPGKFVLRLALQNQGITVNSNSAHFACSGKYIAWMGGDDLMFPNKIYRQVRFMESNPGCTICYHNLRVFDSDSGSLIFFFNDKQKHSGDVKTAIKYGAFNGACSTMVRKEKTPKHGFDLSLPVASDWMYWVDTLANGGSIDYIDEVLGEYRRHGNNITNVDDGVGQNDLDHLVSCQIIIAKYPEFFNDVMSSYASRLIDLRHKVGYVSALWKSFCINPTAKALGAIFIFFVTFGKLKL